MWFRFLLREGYLPNSPVEKVRPPKVPQTSKSVYSVGELTALRRHLERAKTPLAVRDYGLVCLLMDTGARATELLCITLDDIQGDCLLLRQTKGKRPRMVPLGDRSQKALWQYLQRGRPRLRPKDKQLFVTQEGLPMTRNALRCVLVRIGRAVGFPVSAHRFRHTWATMMLRKGVDLETLRRMGGWADYEMLKTYSHLSIEDLKRTQERHSLLDNL
jgi:site-specific recombinase XerD